MQAAQDALARAVAEFDGPQQSRSIVVFDERHRPARGGGRRGRCRRAARTSSPRPTSTAAARTSASASRRRPPRTSASSSSSSPTTRSRRRRVSPKVVELFDSVKRTLVGYLAVSSQPAGAQVTLVSPGGARTDLGLTDFFPIEVLAGDYTVEVAPPGLPDRDAAGQHRGRGDRDAARCRSSRVLRERLLRHRAGGRRGLGRRRAAGDHARAAWRPSSTRRRGRAGLDPAQRLGAHRDREPLARQPRARAAPQAATRRSSARSTPRSRRTTPVDPIKLEDSLASLQAHLRPAGRAHPAERRGARRDARPDRRHLLRARCASRSSTRPGSSSRTWCSTKDEAISLDCPIRPTLAFLGVEAASAAGLAPPRRRRARRSRQNLSRLASLNFIAAPREAVDRMLEQDKLTRQALLPGSGTDPDLVRKVTRAAGRRRSRCRASWWPCCPRSGCSARRGSTCWPPGNTTAEAVDVDLRRGAPPTSRSSRGSTRSFAQRAAVERARHRGHAAARRRPRAARRAGQPRGRRPASQPGDVVLGRGRPAREADRRPAGRGRGEEAGRQAGAAGAGRRRGLRSRAASTLTLGASAREIPLFDPDLVYNKVMMDLRARGRGLPGHRGGGLRLAQPRALRDALLRLRGRPRLPAEGEGGAAAAARALARHRALLPRASPSRSSATGRRRWRPTARRPRRKDATLIDNDGPGGGAPRRAAGRPVSAGRAPRLGAPGRRRRWSSRSTARRSRWAATRTSRSASTSPSSRAATRASRGGAKAGSWSTSARPTSPASTASACAASASSQHGDELPASAGDAS